MAGSMTETLTKLGPDKRKLTLACTSHTDNSFAVAISAATIAKLDGMYFYNITAYPGGTAPTTDTDLTIVATKSGTNKSIDILGGNGTNIIDNTDTREGVPELTALTFEQDHIIDKANIYTPTTANNAVASATFVLELLFTRTR